MLRKTARIERRTETPSLMARYNCNSETNETLLILLHHYKDHLGSRYTAVYIMHVM